MNAGDGAAFRLELTSANCKVWFDGEDKYAKPTRLALFVPGESTRCHLTVFESDFRDATVTLSWTRPPTRLKKRGAITVPLRDVMDVPPKRDR